jgi:16S rRNA (uracil1498-N3)-methyltransferase
VKQFILETKPDKDGIVRLEGGDYRYLVRVRRLAVGESFPALQPNGEETLIHILSVNNGILTGKCAAQENIDPVNNLNGQTSLPPVILFQALPKGDKMDLIVRQAAEGGITEIVPFVSEFSFAQDKAQGQKFSRWERIIKEARQQSGSKTATSIRRPLTESGLFEYWKKLKSTLDDPVNGGLGLLFHHQGLEQESLHSYLNNVPKITAFAVGPEGGFSVKEVSLFLENGFKPFTIGDTVLRTDTAALYCAAVIKILLLERDSWELKQK